MSKKRKALLITVALLLAVTALWLFLQFVYPHFTSAFTPTYPQIDLTSTLSRPQLTQEDYQTLFLQTGLGPQAIDSLRAQGQAGLEQILETQRAFFDPPENAPCAPLGVTTREHRFRDSQGYIVYATPLAPLQEGDILVSFSTHTAGWSHGHAGLVVDPDPDKPVTLESVVLGSLSAQMNANHWRSYTTMMILRPKSDDVTRHQVAQFALKYLDGVPYSLVSGVFGDKFQPVDGPHAAHCGYLPWYAWMSVGLDLDGDGGRVASPHDLSLSPNVDIVQLYGIDPAEFPLF